MNSDDFALSDRKGRQGLRRLEAFQVIFVIIALLVVPATLTLHSVREPGRLQIDSDNPTPLGYTWSLLLFLLPMAVLVGWMLRRSDLVLARRAFIRTLAILVPVGFVLDLLFGHAFFSFQNEVATLGLRVPAVGGPLPIEEFIFYMSGFAVVLLVYMWADEYWLAAYNIPDYGSAAAGLPRIVRFHWPSLALGAGLLALAVFYKKVFSPSPEGFPWYFTYLVIGAFVPSAGFFRTAQPFINWRAFSFTFFFILLVSLLWEVTLAIPYLWWGYHEKAMMGLTIGAWWNLPVEAVCVWLQVTFTTVILYEVIKIWLAGGKRAREAFFGLKPR